MEDKKDVASEDQVLTIPKGWFVCGCDFDKDPPTCKICKEDDVLEERELLIPPALAYYLTTSAEQVQGSVGDGVMTTKKEDIITYVELLVDLHLQTAHGKCDSDEAEKIRDKMDGPWGRISKEDLLRLNWVAVNLNKIQDALGNKS